MFFKLLESIFSYTLEHIFQDLITIHVIIDLSHFFLIDQSGFSGFQK
jgi:hypothetical protein